jgi:hypothetical protein
MEAATVLYEPTISSMGPTGNVNILLDIKVFSSLLSDCLPVYKMPLPFR